MNNNNVNLTIPKNPWLIFWVTSVGVILSCLDAGIVNVALPTITEQFAGSNILLSQWVISSYLFVVCITLPLWGKLGDMYSRNNFYLVGFAIFTISSFLCGASTTIQQLIFFRCIQGLGGAMIVANNQAIIIATIPKEKHGIALGINSMLASAGYIAGPGIGGLILTFFDWRSIFYVNVPIGIIGCILGYKFLPKITKGLPNKIDLVGAALFAVGMYSFLTFLTDLGEKTCSINRVIVYVLIAATSWAIFYLWEKRVTHPMLDFKMFNNKVFLVGVILSFIVITILGINGIILPFYLQNQLHLSHAALGLVLLVSPFFTVVLAPISGYLADRIQQSILTNIGLFIALLGLVYQFFLTQNSHIAHSIISQALIGAGFGIFQTPNNYTILTNVPTSHVSVSSSISALMRNTGKTFGTIIAIVSFTMVQNLYTNKINSVAIFFYGFKAAFIIAILLAILGIWMSWRTSEKI